MTNSIYNQAKEIQKLAGKLLYEEAAKPYTDIEEWRKQQEMLAKETDALLKQEGATPEEEAEIVLAILMGYTIAVRNRKNIAKGMERAWRVMPKIQDPELKCRLAVFCYGECRDEELAATAHRLIGELRQNGNEEATGELEELLLSFAE